MVTKFDWWQDSIKFRLIKKKDMKCKTKDFQSCREFIEDELALHLIIDIKTVKAGELNIRLGFNQLDPIMTKQQAIVWRLRKLFSNEEIIEDVSTLSYLIEFYFPKYKLAIEVDELGHKDRDQTKENKRQKDLKEYLVYKFIRIIPEEENVDVYDGLKKILTFINELKKKENKKSLIDDLSKRPLKLKFKSNRSIKLKCFKWVVEKTLLTI